jgi:hypothetical protein
MTWYSDAFICKVRCPNNIAHSVEFSKVDTGLTMKDKIDSSTGYSKTEMKVFFDNIEVTDDEIFEDLARRGFTVDSELETRLINPFEIIVDCSNGRKLLVHVTRQTRLLAVGNASCPEMKIPIGLAGIMIGDKEIDQQRTIAEMELVEGSVVVQKLYPFSNLFLKSDSLTPSIILPMVQYVKTVSKTKLDNNCSEKLFDRFCWILKKYEGNEEVYHCLMSILSKIYYRGISTGLGNFNQYFDRINLYGIETELTVNVKKIVEEREKDGKKMDEKEEEIVFAYSWLMKRKDNEKSLVLPLANILVGILERSVKEEEKEEAEMKAVLALQCLFENACLLFF